MTNARKARATRRTTAARSAAANGSDNAEAATTEETAAPAETATPAEEATPFPGVLVLRVPGDQPGNEQVQVMPINGMDTLAVPTLLKIGLKVHEQQLGLAERS